MVASHYRRLDDAEIGHQVRIGQKLNLLNSGNRPLNGGLDLDVGFWGDPTPPKILIVLKKVDGSLLPVLDVVFPRPGHRSIKRSQPHNHGT